MRQHCKACFEAAKKFFPGLSDSDIFNLLISCTAYPASSCERTAEQLQEMAANTNGTLEDCFRLANEKMDVAMRGDS